MKHYLLVGAGGTGSILAPHLMRYLRTTHGSDFTLEIADGDIVEDKNLARQGFRPSDVGKSKALALIAQLNQQGFGHDNLLPIIDFLDDTNLPLYMLNGSTVLIAVDNFPVRASIERHALTLPNVTVINAGNETDTSTCQIFIRQNNQNITPPLSYQHPEILQPGLTRAEESCLVRAENPDNEQTIAANLMSAAWMLSALVHTETLPILDGFTDDYIVHPGWHELHASIHMGKAGGPDWRDMGTDAWRSYQPAPAQLVEA